MAVTIDKQRVILKFEDIVLSSTTRGVAGPTELSLNVCGGELVMVRLARLEQTSIFADACAGLVQPASGAIHFLGRNWSELPPDQANALRGRIGRVFRAGSWINQLSLMDNILLPQQHHTRRPADQLREEASRLAEQFGLPGIPLDFPGDIPAADLKRAACVRAFLGRPVLILLEEPISGSSLEIISALMRTIQQARARGAAVIWLTQKGSIWHDQTLPLTQRYRLIAGELMEVTT